MKQVPKAGVVEIEVVDEAVVEDVVVTPHFIILKLVGM